jgi:serine/threonine protein kinase
LAKKKFGRWVRGDGVGEGGQGRVARVTDSKGEFSEPLVIKVLNNVARKERFKSEIDAVRRLRHPNILRIFDFDLSHDPPFYIAEFCAQCSLFNIGGQTFQGDVEKAVSILDPIIDALAEAHKAGITHRDIKPKNILMRADGTPVLADFGICHIDGQETVTLTDEAMGSKNFIAPEMESGQNGQPSPATDVYSIAKVLYWMLSGGREFAREDHRGSRSIATLLDDQRFEHVHMLLDRTILNDSTKRLSLNNFQTQLHSTRRLIAGGYAPLRASIGITCRFCGLGQYKPWKTGTSVEQVGLLGHRSGTTAMTANVLTCSHCGHIEWFRWGGSSQWFDE